ncbi:MAG: heat-inducible transcriptional repressor HrcA [Oscillospiraceae bacterium]|nr:heat-inducible transcriptional repressor HrcA [Oscillospiraceae bacterium]
MDISERKQKILAMVVEQYITTGEPVGSKSITVLLGNAVSSATVRAEMAELSEMGFLEQPHTSAGRVPSQKGYRYYVDRLMGKYELSSAEQHTLHNRLRTHAGEPEKVLEKAGGILAELTGCAAVSSTPLDEHTSIKRVELVPMGAKTALVVFLTSSGVLKSRVCRCDSEITIEMVELFYNIAAAEFIEKHPSDIHTAGVQTIAASLGDKALAMTPLLVTLSELCAAAAQSELLLEGQSNLLNHKELENSAAELMEFLKQAEPLSRLLSSKRDDLSILIGKENFFKELENSSMILARYHIGGQNAGSLGIIGPTRIDYARLIPSIRYLSYLVGNLLSEALDEES